MLFKFPQGILWSAQGGDSQHSSLEKTLTMGTPIQWSAQEEVLSISVESAPTQGEVEQVQICFTRNTRLGSYRLISPIRTDTAGKPDVVKAGLVWLEQSAPDYWKNHWCFSARKHEVMQLFGNLHLFQINLFWIKQTKKPQLSDKQVLKAVSQIEKDLSWLFILRPHLSRLSGGQDRLLPSSAKTEPRGQKEVLWDAVTQMRATTWAFMKKLHYF